ncbi:uncharacterized protein J3D65DRAFT_416090 [Phyllosticta citribraziliensis]|uniref:Uncharacterized protein n=1 Tax=Phyllosticta citribraziliensis TaxID=989973 RepID=A0ABR1LRH5_9PEZI
MTGCASFHPRLPCFHFTCSRPSHCEAIGNWDAHLDRPRVPQPATIGRGIPKSASPGAARRFTWVHLHRCSKPVLRPAHAPPRLSSLLYVSPGVTCCNKLDSRPTCDAVSPELHFLPISITEGLIRAPRQSLRFQFKRDAGAMYCRQINVTRQNQQQPRGLIGDFQRLGASTPQTRTLIWPCVRYRLQRRLVLEGHWPRSQNQQHTQTQLVHDPPLATPRT